MNRAEYEEMEAKRIERNLAYLDAGVVFIDLKMAYIDEGVKIGKGTVIYPCVVLEGNVEIGENSGGAERHINWRNRSME